MSAINIRPARLDDTAAISALFRARIGAWQRWDTLGRVQDVAYEALSVYERWLHGGAWMSVETAALHLGALLLGAGIALVAEVHNGVAGYLEAYHNVEPPPFGSSVSPSHLVVAAAHSNMGLEDMLLEALAARAKALKCERLTAVVIGTDTAFYVRHQFKPLARIVRYSLPARTGQVFYKANDHSDMNAAQISGWQMPVGRITSARQQWEALWTRAWEIIPEMRRTYRLKFNAAGQESYIAFQPQLYNPRALDVYVWSPKPLSTQLLTAIRDWAYKENYRTLVMAVPDDTAKTLGQEAEADGYSVEVYAVNA
jgi:ribosomal protein S18 acetylase RimI-like enzyme